MRRLKSEMIFYQKAQFSLQKQTLRDHSNLEQKLQILWHRYIKDLGETQIVGFKN